MTERPEQRTDAVLPLVPAERPPRPSLGSRRPLLEAAAAASVAAAGWGLLASLHPTTTYHFAPVVTVAILAFYVRARTEQPVTIRTGLLLSTIGALLALTTTAVLWSLDALRGPTLWGPTGALAETLLAIAVGFLAGQAAAIPARK